MKVSLKPGTEKRGLILSKEIHTLEIKVQMSEEEVAACRAANLMKQELFVLPLDIKTGRGMTVTVNDLARGFTDKAVFPDFLDASSFNSDVKDILVKLKTAIEAKMNEADEEFEL